MFSSLVALLERKLGEAAHSVLPAILDEVKAILERALSGGPLSLHGLVLVLEREVGKLAGSLAPELIAEVERIVAQAIVDRGIGPEAVGLAGGGDTEYNPFSHVEDEIKKAINSLGDQVKSGIKAAEGEAVKSINSAEAGALNALKKTAKGVEAVASRIEGAALAKLTKGALNKAAELAAALGPNEASVTLGPVTCSFDPAADVAALRSAASHPPRDREGILNVVKTLTSGTVSVSVSAELSALVVSSDSLAVGFEGSWNTATFVERFHDIMDLIGF